MKISFGRRFTVETPWAIELPRHALWLIPLFVLALLVFSPEAALLGMLAMLAVVGERGRLDAKLSCRTAPFRSFLHLLWLLPLVVICNGLLTLLWLAAMRKIGLHFNSEQDVARMLYDSGGAGRLQMLFLILVVAPVFEELFYRRLLFNLLLPLGGIAAFILTALIFSLSHAFAAGVPALFLLGSVFQFTYIKSGDIMYPIVFHILFNFNSTLMIIYFGSM